MPNTLSKTGITTGATVETWHITQSIDAFTGTTPYDIFLQGSFDVNSGLLTVNSDDTIVFGSGFVYDSNISSIAAGYKPTAIGIYSFSQGNSSLASGDYSHAEGQLSTSSGDYSHAEGIGAQSSGMASHAEGKNTQALGDNSHAEGEGTTALGDNSHAEGSNTVASGSYQLVVGAYNTQGDNTSLFIIGNGSSNVNRRDAFKVTKNNSIQMPITQSTAPTWSGSNGEMIPVTTGSRHYLYMWMGGAWRRAEFT